MQDNSDVAEIELNQIFSVVMVIAITVAGVAYMLNVMGDIKTDMGTASCLARTDGFTSYNATAAQCQNSSGSHTAVLSADFNGTRDGMVAVAKFPTKMTLVATIVIAVIIITLLTRYFRF